MNNLVSTTWRRHTVCKSNQIKIKSLLLSHHHSTSALVSEILMSVLQTVQKNNRQFTYGQTVQKKQQTIYIWTDSAKKTTNNLHMDGQCKKNNKQFTYGRTVQKKQQTIYIWTDSAKKTTNNLHMDGQCKKNNKQFTYVRTVQKKPTNNLHMDRQCKKNNKQFTYGQTVQKKQQTIYIWTDSAQKKQQTIYIWTDSATKQQQFTYGQYIFTDCTEDNVQNTHTYTQYT